MFCLFRLRSGAAAKASLGSKVRFQSSRGVAVLTEQTEVGLLAKLNVADVGKSADWYETKLGLTHDPRFDTEDWRQLNVPGVTGAALGLWQGSPTGSGG